MKSKEEFYEENKELKELINLVIGEGKISSYMRDTTGQILENPGEYAEAISAEPKLKNIEINIVNNQDFFDGVKTIIRNVNDNVKIENQVLGTASKDELFKGEEIIDEVVSQIDPTWNAKQKLAFVHYNMGKLVSYLPDYDSQKQIMPNEKIGNARNIWKGLTDKQAVCNGITAIQRTILARVGVETEELTSNSHSFLLTKTEDGNIITDATWDLDRTLYGLPPKYFGLSYDELRKEDGNGNAHKLKGDIDSSFEPPAHIRIDNDELRNIYQSIGIIGKDKAFNSEVANIITEIKSQNISDEEKIELLFKKMNERESDKFGHREETSKMLTLAAAQIGVIDKIPISQFIYEKGDKNFDNPKLVMDFELKDGKHKVKRIDSEEGIIASISNDELKNYTYHKKNDKIQFWNNQQAKNELEQESKDENSKELDIDNSER